jgi:hypothetical protein
VLFYTPKLWLNRVARRKSSVLPLLPYHVVHPNSSAGGRERCRGDPGSVGRPQKMLLRSQPRSLTICHSVRTLSISRPSVLGKDVVFLFFGKKISSFSGFRLAPSPMHGAQILGAQIHTQLSYRHPTTCSRSSLSYVHRFMGPFLNRNLSLVSDSVTETKLVTMMIRNSDETLKCT